MRPAFSVILLTTLIGAGQGLFLSLCALSFGGAVGLWAPVPDAVHVAGALLAVLLMAGGLAASFFHLGHPERAWRTAAKWRTSWLSREVIALPLALGFVALYGAAHHPSGAVLRPALAWIASGGVAACIALYVCTAMIYACLKFLQEWASPLTVVNFTLLGIASGLTLASALVSWLAPQALTMLGTWALIATALAFVGRSASLARNARLRPVSTLATAIGVKHPVIEQRAAGFLGGSFNTREFFHGRSQVALRAVRGGFLLFAFAIPLLLLAAGIATLSTFLLVAAVSTQFLGLLAERWYFFAEANHPQNLYYRAIA